MPEIPHILHQIWLGPKPFPELAQTWRDAWAALHPGWEMRLWTDENLPPMRNASLFRIYQDRVGFRSDLLRYEVVYRYGGVYVDVDFEPRRSIEPLLDGVDVFLSCDLPGIPVNGLFGSVACHPFLKFLLDGLQAHVRNYGTFSAFHASGPGYVRDRLANYPQAAEVTLLRPEHFYPYRGANNEDIFNEAEFDGYAIHRWWGSWFQEAPR